MSKDDEHYDLLKVPDSEIIKQLRIEIGLLTSERDEVLYELKLSKENPIEHKQSENSAYIFSLEGQVKNLKLKIDKLESESSHVGLKSTINELHNINDVNSRLIETLRKELFKYAKEHGRI